MMIKAYHESRGDHKRTKVIVPDSAHGTNPASAAVTGFDTVEVASDAEGMVDLDALKALMDDTVAALMLTNPNTLGVFERNILALTETIHAAGGLVYYDGANANAIMGKARARRHGIRRAPPEPPQNLQHAARRGRPPEQARSA